MRRRGQGDPILLYSFEAELVVLFVGWEWKAVLWTGHRHYPPNLSIKQNIICLMLNYIMCPGYFCFGFKSESLCFLLNNEKHTAGFSRGVTGRDLNGSGCKLCLHQLGALT